MLYLYIILLILFLFLIKKKYYEHFENSDLEKLGFPIQTKKCFDNISNLNNPLQKSQFIHCMQNYNISENTLKQKLPQLFNLPSPASGDFDISLDMYNTFSTMSQQNMHSLLSSF